MKKKIHRSIYVITMGREAKYLSHLLPVSFGVEGCLSEQGGVLLRGHTQLVVKSVVPDLIEGETKTVDVSCICLLVNL